MGNVIYFKISFKIFFQSIYRQPGPFIMAAFIYYMTLLLLNVLVLIQACFRNTPCECLTSVGEGDYGLSIKICLQNRTCVYSAYHCDHEEVEVLCDDWNKIYGFVN